MLVLVSKPAVPFLLLLHHNSLFNSNITHQCTFKMNICISNELRWKLNFINCALLQPNLHSHSLPRTHSSSSLPGKSHVWSDDELNASMRGNCIIWWWRRLNIIWIWKWMRSSRLYAVHFVNNFMKFCKFTM